jgi:hypothetical protein
LVCAPADAMNTKMSVVKKIRNCIVKFNENAAINNISPAEIMNRMIIFILYYNFMIL